MNLNLFSFAGLTLSITSFVLTFIILFFGKNILHRIWALFNITIGLWGAGAFFIGTFEDKDIALSMWRVIHIPIIFIPIFMFHVIYILCNLRSKKFLYFIYIQGVIFSILSVTSRFFIPNVRFVFNSFYYDVGGPLFHPFFAIWGFIVGYAHFKLFTTYLHSKGKLKSQTLYLLIGSGLGFSGGITNFLPVYGIGLYPFGNFTIPIYSLIVTYAIVRYHLMDINVIIKKTAVYSLSAGILASLFVVLVLTMTTYLSDLVGITSFTITVVASLIIAFLFNPLRNRIQTLIDKIFYKKTYDYYAIIRKVSHDLASMFDFKKIYSFIGDTIFSTLGLRNIYLLSALPAGDYEVVYHKSFRIEKAEQLKVKEEGGEEGERLEGGGTIQKDEEKSNEEEIIMDERSEIIKFFDGSNGFLLKDELPLIKETRGQEVMEHIESNLERFQGEVVVPVFVDDKLTFLLILGEKLSGDMFTNEDFNLLNTVSNQTAIAIKNARLYKEKLSSEKLASIGMMSATFAHDIRNPLTSIRTFAELIPYKYSDKEFREKFSGLVVDDVERIDRLIEDYLDFSSKERYIKFNRVDIVKLVDKIINRLGESYGLEMRNISVEKNYKNTKIHVTGDEKKLNQVFSNIIANSFQAMHENSVLKVYIDQNDRDVDIVISDTGRGISPGDMAKIFEPFFTTKKMGTGLGLAISKKIIEDHGGRIKAESKLSKGTTFTISLPV